MVPLPIVLDADVPYRNVDYWPAHGLHAESAGSRQRELHADDRRKAGGAASQLQRRDRGHFLAHSIHANHFADCTTFDSVKSYTAGRTLR
jgi:hypothetical protein